MGTNCAPLLADLFLYSYENEFLDNMIRSGHRRLARSFNLCYRYIDDLIVFNNKKFLDYLKEIYPSQLTVEKANKSDHLADYLDLTFIIDSGGKLSTRLYDKRDDFDFHIVNFPFLSSNVPSGARSKFWGCQGRRTGVGVTTVSNSLILGGWVTKVLKNGNKKYGGGRVGDNNILTFLSYCTR